MEQKETLEISTQPEDGVVIFEQFKEKVIKTFDGQIVEKVTPLRQRFEKLKEDYKGAEIVTDPASMKKAKEATAAFRTFKGEVESNRKLLKGIVLQLGDSVDGNHNPIYEEAENMQKIMDAPAKAFEEKQKAERQAEKIALAKRKTARFDQLTQLGAFTSNGVFILGDATAMEGTVELCTDEAFNDILSTFKEAHDKIEAEAKEQERLKQEAADKLRQEQEEFQRQKEEFEKQQHILKEQQEALRKQQEEIEKRDRIRQEEVERALRWEKAEAERKEREKFEAEQKAVENALKQRREARIGQMSELGLIYNGQYQSFVFEDVNVHVNELILEDKEWDTLIETITPVIADRKAEAERKRQEEEEKQRKEKELDDRFFIREAQLRSIGLLPAAYMSFLRNMPDADYESYYNAEFAAFENKKHEEWLETERVKKMQEQEREKERLADLSENKRWREWVEKKLMPFVADMPAFEGKRYARARAIATEKLQEIISLKPGNF